MSTVIISIIFIVAIVIIFVAFRVINKRNIKKKNDKLLAQFSQTGTSNGLSFSSQEILRNKIIGLDGIQRKLVMVNEKEECTIVALDEVKKCAVIKNFQTYNLGGDKNSDIERQLTSIGLVFEFKKQDNPVSILFYDNMIHPVFEAAAMEAKANDWEKILSKLLNAA
ncbi:MAG TPA: hypothetical protein VN726_17790 [Hanamia sp.]|nr:hypothetical protein [Hanamia sp.]